jgi:serine/threonine protein kinase
MTSTGERRYMQASTVEDRDEWIAAIRKSASSTDSKDKEQKEVKPKEDNTKLTPDHFNFIKVLGRGNYGKVMLATKKDEPEGTHYALKVIKKTVLTDRSAQEHILSENKVLQSMNNPFLVQMHYAFQSAVMMFKATHMVGDSPPQP